MAAAEVAARDETHACVVYRYPRSTMRLQICTTRVAVGNQLRFTCFQQG